MASRVFTKDILKSVNHMARVMGFNSAVTPQFLETLDDNKFYMPVFTLLHEHKAGKSCEPHMRCVFREPEGMFTIDVEMGCWDLVPTVEDVMERIKHNENTAEPATAE
jgi:hypothetical protein